MTNISVIAESYNRKGFDFYLEGKYVKAQEAFEIAISISESAAVFFNLGLVFRKLENDKEARRCFERALELNPNTFDAEVELAGLDNKTGQEESARERYKKILEKQPKLPWVFLSLANEIYENLPDSEDALYPLRREDAFHSVSKAIALSFYLPLDTQFPYEKAFFRRGSILSTSEKYQQDAVHDYTTAIKWAESKGQFLPEAYWERACVYDKLGEKKLAESDYEIVGRYKPELAFEFFNKGLDYASQHDYKEALYFIQKAIALIPDYAEAHFELSLIYLDKEEEGSKEWAWHHYQTALKLKPELSTREEGEWFNELSADMQLLQPLQTSTELLDKCLNTSTETSSKSLDAKVDLDTSNESLDSTFDMDGSTESLDATIEFHRNSSGKFFTEDKKRKLNDDIQGEPKGTPKKTKGESPKKDSHKPNPYEFFTDMSKPATTAIVLDDVEVSPITPRTPSSPFSLGYNEE